MKIWDSVYISLAHPLEQQFFPLSLYLLLFFPTCVFLSLVAFCFCSLNHFTTSLAAFILFLHHFALFSFFFPPKCNTFSLHLLSFYTGHNVMGSNTSKWFLTSKNDFGRSKFFVNFFVIFWEWSSITSHVLKCRWTFSGMRFAKSVWSIYTLICLNTWVVYMCLFFTACSMK